MSSLGETSDKDEYPVAKKEVEERETRKSGNN